MLPGLGVKSLRSPQLTPPLSATWMAPQSGLHKPSGRVVLLSSLRTTGSLYCWFSGWTETIFKPKTGERNSLLGIKVVPPP